MPSARSPSSYLQLRRGGGSQAVTGKSPLLPVRPLSFLAASFTESQDALGAGRGWSLETCEAEATLLG